LVVDAAIIPGINLRMAMSMRGVDQNQDVMFSYLSSAAQVNKDRPWLPIKKMVSQALVHDFNPMHAKEGRPSIAPGKLLGPFAMNAY